MASGCELIVSLRQPVKYSDIPLTWPYLTTYEVGEKIYAWDCLHSWVSVSNFICSKQQEVG